MIRHKWVVLVTFALVCFVFGVQGCGSDNGTDVTSGDSGAGENDGSGSGDGTFGDATFGDATFSDGSSADGSKSDSGSGDSGADGAVCKMLADSCSSNGECCSDNCDLTAGVCAVPRCKVAGDLCTTGNECCTFVCDGTGHCGSTQCISDNMACSSDSSCCGGKCSTPTDGAPRTCVPLNTTCKTSGNTCLNNTDCCSSYCNGGFCSSTPSFCTQTGDVCSTDAECCGGICTIAVGATLGNSSVATAPGAGGCTVAGEVCSAVVNDAGVAVDGGSIACGGNCCSRSCAPYGPTGVDVCQYPSGCRPVGEICREDGDCCGSATDPGGSKGDSFCSKGTLADGGIADVGRCEQGTGCQAAGTVCRLATTSCNASDNCCNGSGGPDVQTHPYLCQQDDVGIPRCTQVGSCADAGSKAGLPCSTSADCCGLACVPTNVTDGGAPFICGGSCQAAGSTCSTNADCCPGLPCVLPPGGSSGTCGGALLPDGGLSDGGSINLDGGTCALYGQECEAGADCCDNVPCTAGRCLTP